MARDRKKHEFRFKQFSLDDSRCGMKIGTDGLLLGAWSALEGSPRHILDIGAGCGIVGLMMAQRFQEAYVHFVEIDTEAGEDLKDNIRRTPWAGRCAVTIGSYVSVDTHETDCIVSNPPYFDNGDTAPDSRRAMARHAGELSPGALVDYAAAHLQPGGMLSMIVPAGQLETIESHAAFKRMSVGRVTLVNDRPGMAARRALIELHHGAAVRRQTQLSIRHADGSYTAEYTELTRHFHPHL